MSSHFWDANAVKNSLRLSGTRNIWVFLFWSPFFSSLWSHFLKFSFIDFSFIAFRVSSSSTFFCLNGSFTPHFPSFGQLNFLPFLSSDLLGRSEIASYLWGPFRLICYTVNLVKLCQNRKNQKDFGCKLNVIKFLGREAAPFVLTVFQLLFFSWNVCRQHSL